MHGYINSYRNGFSQPGCANFGNGYSFVNPKRAKFEPECNFGRQHNLLVHRGNGWFCSRQFGQRS